MANNNTPNQTRAVGLPKRTPVSAQNKLTFREIPGYKCRVVNDKPEDQGQRIEMFKRAGYEVVTSEEILGDPLCGQSGSVGSEVSKPVGMGTRGVLMKIKQEWYDEDQARKAQIVNEKEATLLREMTKKGLTTKLGSQQLDGIRFGKQDL